MPCPGARRVPLLVHIKLKVYGHIYSIYRASKPFQKTLSN